MAELELRANVNVAVDVSVTLAQRWCQLLAEVRDR